MPEAMPRRRRLAALLLLVPLVGTRATRADPGGEIVPLLSRYERIASLDVPLPELSGLAWLSAPSPHEQAFLAVSDDGRFDPGSRTVPDALYRLTLSYGDDGAVRVAASKPVPLSTGAHLERVDPAWGARVPLDLEAVVPVPGIHGLFLLSGERNPEDATDDGANRVYLVRIGGADEARAELLAYFRLPDLPDDLSNDRFEALVVLPPFGEDPRTRAWPVYAFKERTAVPNRTPRIRRFVLSGLPDAPRLDRAVSTAGPPLPDEPLSEDPTRVSSQSDATLAADGSVWVLDRWRRLLQVTTAEVPLYPLVIRETLDAFDAISEVAGERGRLEPGAPASPRGGFGRHEALCFDPDGRLYLGADLGEDRPSHLTVLAPRRGD